ncbi:hypothetical protein ABZS76_33200 [Streptomyces sp. NPDC005562]|uniref:hypothetical protein n=1 Tax=Streptomyces sp. NPDC005562 TaxID=3154890 RepID=UPI0033AB4439
MSPAGALFTVAAALMVSADFMLVMSALKMLPWRVSCAFIFVASLLSFAIQVTLDDWLTAGISGTSAAFAAHFWWKHRNDDDDDDTKRRRRRVRSRLAARLPKQKAFARPVPASN